VSELSCKELVELVTDYFDDALPAEERREFEHHIGLCAGCTEHLVHLRLTIRAVGTLSEESLQPAAREELLATFRSWKRGGE
jgi:anti-sigma factor RsiW